MLMFMLPCLVIVLAAIALSGLRIAALELRRMQKIAEVGAESNSTTVLMLPSNFVTLSKTLSDSLRERTSKMDQGI